MSRRWRWRRERGANSCRRVGPLGRNAGRCGRRHVGAGCGYDSWRHQVTWSNLAPRRHSPCQPDLPSPCRVHPRFPQRARGGDRRCARRAHRRIHCRRATVRSALSPRSSGRHWGRSAGNRCILRPDEASIRGLFGSWCMVEHRYRDNRRHPSGEGDACNLQRADRSPLGTSYGLSNNSSATRRRCPTNTSRAGASIHRMSAQSSSFTV